MVDYFRRYGVGDTDNMNMNQGHNWQFSHFKRMWVRLKLVTWITDMFAI